MGELPGRRPEYIALIAELSAGICAAIQESTRQGLRAKRGVFYPKKINSPRYRMAYYGDEREAVLEIDDGIGTPQERQTVFHFRKEGGPVLITGYVDYDWAGKKKTLYFLSPKDSADKKVVFEDSEEWVGAKEAGIDDLRIIAGLIKDPLAGAALLELLPLLKS